MQIVRQSIFETEADVIVCPVNTIGIMGAGLARIFKLKYLDMYKLYVEHCNTGALAIGKLWHYRKTDPSILCFPTKEHWKYPSKLEYIDQGLQKFQDSFQAFEGTIAFPMLGCGHGGLDSDCVLELMDEYLKPMKLKTIVCQYK